MQLASGDEAAQMRTCKVHTCATKVDLNKMLTQSHKMALCPRDTGGTLPSAWTERSNQNLTATQAAP